MAYIIAINGPSCSGKTYISNIIRNIAPSRITIVSYDDYCCDHGDLSLEEIKKINYDVPAAYDAGLLYEHAHKLKDNQAIECPIYDFSIHRRTSDTNHIESNEVVIIEGIMVFQVEELMKDNTYDLKVAVTANKDVRFERRFKRDQIERGRTPESISYQWNTTVQPSCEKYIDPLARKADILLENDSINGEVRNLDLVINKVKEVLGL